MKNYIVIVEARTNDATHKREIGVIAENPDRAAERAALEISYRVEGVRAAKAVSVREADVPYEPLSFRGGTILW
jgi:hypothetical protein